MIKIKSIITKKIVSCVSAKQLMPSQITTSWSGDGTLSEVTCGGIGFEFYSNGTVYIQTGFPTANPFHYLCLGYLENPQARNEFVNQAKPYLEEIVCNQLQRIGIQIGESLHFTENEIGLTMSIPGLGELGEITIPYDGVTITGTEIKITVLIDGKEHSITSTRQAGTGAVAITSDFIRSADEQKDIDEKVSFAQLNKEILGKNKQGEDVIKQSVVDAIKTTAEISHLKGPLLNLALYQQGMKELTWLGEKFKSPTSKRFKTFQNKKFLEHLETLKEEFTAAYNEGSIDVAAVSQIVYRASVLSVHPKCRGSFPLVRKSVLQHDKDFTEKAKWEELLQNIKGSRIKDSQTESTLSMQAVQFHGELNDLEIMLAMNTGAYFMGVLEPGQCIYADGYMVFGDSLNCHDHGHRGGVTNDYFLMCLKENQFEYVIPRSITIADKKYKVLKDKRKGSKGHNYVVLKDTDGNEWRLAKKRKGLILTSTQAGGPNKTIAIESSQITFDQQFDICREFISTNLEKTSSAEEKKAYLQKANLALFLHGHEPFSMGLRNDFSSESPSIQETQVDERPDLMRRYFYRGNSRYANFMATEGFDNSLSKAALLRFLDPNDAAGLIADFLPEGISLPVVLDPHQETAPPLSLKNIEEKKRCVIKRKLRTEVLAKAYLRAKYNKPCLSTKKPLTRFKGFLKKKPEVYRDSKTIRWPATFTEQECTKVFDYMAAVEDALVAIENALEDIGEGVRRIFVKEHAR